MPKIKGVNLGGWFVLERWMKQSLFENVDSKDETGFVLKHPNPKEALINHWKTWITKDDFFWLKSIGIDSVRIPIPWWLLDDKPYFSPLEYIKNALSWADEVGLSVMLDLHTAPGCQNGFDNGGIEGVIDWPKDPKNIKLTVERLGFIARELATNNSVFAIEVLNEPHFNMDLDIIQNFYKDAYQEIRKYSSKKIVFHDAFRPNDSSWLEFFKTNSFENIGFDLHLYHCFDEKLTHGTPKTHVDEIFNVRIPTIQKLNSIIPVYIGEWSLGIRQQTLVTDLDFDYLNFEKMLASLQLYAYNYASGYYFWSYKIEHQEAHHGWDFRSLIKRGILHI
ncbi:cellulase family glycosylhydrolase [Acholeplasma equirhinis]|uniref:glycoside hydrolase family 5 protein n=1 Tax=Acholeplasma equirhinis TaxID=555393 RepID=UPI00197B0447|nr:cellulase family glycosylhydrolase [Acholeplasma equirhinis]MBN3490156.1 cellulase family glycosylhydrolase [Acholeplasma equirhinis]